MGEVVENGDGESANEPEINGRMAAARILRKQ